MPTSSTITIGPSEWCCPGFVDVLPFWEKDAHDAEKKSTLCKLFRQQMSDYPYCAAPLWTVCHAA